MESNKRLCTVSSRFAAKLQSDPPKKTIQDLPLELLVEILSYLSLSKVVPLRNLCQSFRLAVAFKMSRALRRVRLRVEKKVDAIKNEFVGSIIERRPIPTDFIYYWWNLQNELCLLNVTLRRYREDMQIWCYLASLLAGVFETIEDDIKCSSGETQAPRYGVGSTLPVLDKFLRRFTTEIEIHFHASETYVPFETKLADLLLCCPTGNIKMVIERYNDSSKRTNMNFSIRVPKTNFRVPSVKESASRLQNEIEILCFMRRYVRDVNSFQTWHVITKMAAYSSVPQNAFGASDMEEILMLSTFGVELLFEHRERVLEGGARVDIYEHKAVSGPGRCGLSSSFEINYDESLLPRNRSENENSNPCNNQSSTCRACTLPRTDNKFYLAIKYGSGNEYVVVYDSDKANYSILTSM